jgi:hypothetical protein
MWPSPVARSIGIGRSPQQFVTGTKLEIPLRAVNDHLIVRLDPIGSSSAILTAGATIGRAPADLEHLQA